MGTLMKRHRGGLRPWAAPWDFHEEFSRMFDDFGGGLQRFEEGFSPAIDIRETDDSYIVEVDTPGMKKDEVEIEVADDLLTIKGERKSEHEEERENYHRVERQSGSFRRTISIPGGYNRDTVEAKYEDGVLRITLPKLEESRPRKVKVKGN